MALKKAIIPVMEKDVVDSLNDGVLNKTAVVDLSNNEPTADHKAYITKLEFDNSNNDGKLKITYMKYQAGSQAEGVITLSDGITAPQGIFTGATTFSYDPDFEPLIGEYIGTIDIQVGEVYVDASGIEPFSSVIWNDAGSKKFFDGSVTGFVLTVKGDNLEKVGGAGISWITYTPASEGHYVSATRTI